MEPFWALAIPEPNTGCWLWLGRYAEDGYGVFGNRSRRAHRLAWEWSFGPIPPGLLVCHRCDVPPCVNPGHLFLGTHDENMADMRRKGRKPRGERSERAVLTDAQALEIRRRYAAGERHRDLARAFGVANGTVQWITAGRHFPHLGGPIIRATGPASTSGFKGVSFDRRTGRWMANIHRDRVQIWLGRFDTAEEAARACESARAARR